MTDLVVFSCTVSQIWKLDKEIVQRRINVMSKLGVNFVANTEIGRDITADELLEQYDRVILATGASVPRDLEVPGASP